MTIKELFYECKTEINRGNGDKEIWISRDDEGNGYHRLFYSFLINKKDLDEIKDMGLLEYGDDVNTEEIVILG